MSLHASLARGLFVTTLLAGLGPAAPGYGQYAPTQTYPSTGQSAYRVTYPVTPTSSPASYRLAQAPLESDVPPAPDVPIAPEELDSGPIDVPLTEVEQSYVPPGNGHGHEYAYPSTDHAYPPAGAAYPSTGGACPPGGAAVHGRHGYMNYSPTCNCLDGGYSTWGMWSNYSSRSPCNGGPGSECGWGHRLGHGLFRGGAGCDTCAVGSIGHAVGVAGCAEGCTSCQLSSCAQAPRRVWFGGIYALLMTRDDENTAWTSWDSSNLANQVLSSRDGAVEWQTGNEIRFGSTFLCHCLGWEAVYWGLYEETDEAVITATDIGAPISTVFDFGGLDYDDGGGVSGVNSYFDGAEAHRVRRHFELQNVELNLLYYPFIDSVGPYGVTRAGSGFLTGRQFSFTGSAGFRYLRIDDGFQFASSFSDETFGNDPEDMFYNIEMENHLIGFQLGAAANYRATQRLDLFVDSKFGLFVNYIEHDSQIFGSNGFAVVTGGLPFAGEEYNIQSTKEDVAFLGELRAGVAYWVNPNWRLYGGWRALGIAGYAHPTDQIPLNFAGTPDVRDIDSNGSLIVHGLQVGVEMNY